MVAKAMHTPAIASLGGPGGGPPVNNATDAIQNARNGRSASSELPLTRNAGTAMKSSEARTGRRLKRRATVHMAHTAINENATYAAWNGTSFTSPKISSNPASAHAFPGG